MDDMTAFERQIATVLCRMAGPEPRFDAMEIVRIATTTTQRWRFWPIFDAKRVSFGSRPVSIAASNGRSSTVTGRTRSMFSPAKALVTGSLVFALGGMLLIAQPFEQQGATIPGASSAEPGAQVTMPVEFTGHIVCGPDVRTGTTDIPLSDTETSVVQTRGSAWQPSATMSEPRLEGTYYYSYDDDQYRTKGVATVPSVGSGTWRIENDEGAWQGSHTNVGFSDGTYSAATTILFGEGAYEGLTVIWEERHDNAACTWDVRGMIIGGEVPKAPEAASSE